MKTKFSNPQFVLGLVAASIVFLGSSQVYALSGAIHTSLVDGLAVNANLYEAKEDVYLIGGPGGNAPSRAAGLSEGDYYFQVTDPSGQDLLSSDHISCRRIHVNEHGVFDDYYEDGVNYEYVNGQNGGWVAVACVHNTGEDGDYFDEFGSITVQLYPYDDTPNKGGVYKVWVTRVEDYEGDEDFVPTDKKDQVNGENYQPANYHGFIPSKSKTDNYKVREKGRQFPPPEITVRKFHDKNMDGVQDSDEEDIIGWAVDVSDPTGVTNTVGTPEVIIAAPAGTWTLVEDTPAGTEQTVSIFDGAVYSLYPAADPEVSVDVGEPSKDIETHEVVYGNVGIGSITACKVFDRDGDGIADDDEPGIASWKIVLTGTDVRGTATGPIVKYTGPAGCATFSGLLPGSYTVEEVIPADGTWTATSSTSVTVTIESTLDGSDVIGTAETVTFTNVCFDVADFGTKGFWHNKNGLSLLTEADRDHINGLDPYSGASDYFEDGDEPFDGTLEDLITPVEAAYDEGNLIWGEGTWQSEVSLFLVDDNSAAELHGHREQLAQQLLAFIFNVRTYVGDCGAAIEYDGEVLGTQELIDGAIAAWSAGDGIEEDNSRIAIKDILDWLNNSDAVFFVPCNPCPVVYAE